MWADVYGLVITATGWTITQVEALLWPAAVELLGYWRRCPPMHLAIGALIPKAEGSPSTSTAAPTGNASVEEMLAFKASFDAMHG